MGKYISITALFDDMDTAELAARSIARHFPGVKSVKLHYRREETHGADRYSANALTAANPYTYVNVGYGVVPPQGAAPMFAVYERRMSDHRAYSDRKVKMTVIAPPEKRSAVTSVVLTGGGHFVRVN